MALLDTSFLTYDPDFADNLVWITRSYVINTYGEMILTETATNIVAVVQSGSIDDLDRLPQGAALSDSIVVFYNGKLSTESSPDGYSDVVIWLGQRYQVKSVDITLGHYGAGYTKALCLLEAAYAK